MGSFEVPARRSHGWLVADLKPSGFWARRWSVSFVGTMATSGYRELDDEVR